MASQRTSEANGTEVCACVDAAPNDFNRKVCSPSGTSSGILSRMLFTGCVRVPCKCTVHGALGAITIAAVSARFIVQISDLWGCSLLAVEVFLDLSAKRGNQHPFHHLSEFFLFFPSFAGYKTKKLFTVSRRQRIGRRSHAFFVCNSPRMSRLIEIFLLIFFFPPLFSLFRFILPYFAI